jgi:ketosteroid isomerase-like protein
MTTTDEVRGSRALALRLAVAFAAAAIAAAGCRATIGDAVTETQARAIADTLEGMVRRAYDFSSPNGDVAKRLLSLYPDTGRVVSASAGRVLTSRDSLAEGIRYFWESMGRNMREPRIIWEQMATDVLGSRSAVVTATYRIPHRTPRGEPHELAGAMTLVFSKRGDRWVVVQEHLSDRPGPEADMSDPAAAAPPR